ncbi:gluconolactonase [Marivivens niveibacter]|uniref:Gluconolactonase n=1 Tax=Marivivens niveibacter TaxID=1930667 RepID=A0A251WVV4_9RHOB|nr:SMP-30/gluconolactonase/LRE family protein [Marivivens niveibacter]OUD08093.1 gluconolactonase [Marivivens niveibacter]
MANRSIPPATIYDPRPCFLGEGPLWHPERQQLFWFDIVEHKLLSRVGDETFEWAFDEYVSAAGWIDYDRLFMASETGLWTFNINSGQRDLVASLEADNPITRSNDGRADPLGGFWIGTMGKSAELAAGAIYRFYKGELRTLFTGITISNAICFAPDGAAAYYCCTTTQKIMKTALDSDGWPVGEPSIFVDLSAEGINPDGAVTDSMGYLWNAQWGLGRVARYRPDGTFDMAVSVGGIHSSCPAFGGADFTELFITTAQEGIDTPDTCQVVVYCAKTDVAGQAESRVLLD